MQFVSIKYFIFARKVNSIMYTKGLYRMREGVKALWNTNYLALKKGGGKSMRCR